MFVSWGHSPKRKAQDQHNARIKKDKALKRMIAVMFKDDAQHYYQFQDNESFQRLADREHLRSALLLMIASGGGIPEAG